MKASIIIPTHNRVNSLRKLLHVLSCQNYPREKFEVIVVDDGSTDGTYEFLTSDLTDYNQFNQLNPLFNTDLNLKIITHEISQGSAKAHNDGIKAAQGEIIILLDDDLLPTPSFIKSHLECHRERNCVVIGNIKYTELPNQKWLSRYLSTRGVHKLKNKTNIPFKCFWTGNTSFRKEDIMKVGLFDEQFKGILGGEDLELGYRLEKCGLKFKYAPQAITYHPPCKLDEVLKKQRTFGKDIIPLLLKRAPIFYKILKIDLVEKPNLLIRTILSQHFYRFLKKAIPFLNRFYVPPTFFDYLIFYNRVLGFKESGFLVNRLL